MIFRSPTGCWWNSKEFYLGGGGGVQLTLNTTCVVRVNTRLLMVWSMMQRTGNTVMDTTGDFTLKCAMD